MHIVKRIKRDDSASNATSSLHEVALATDCDRIIALMVEFAAKDAI